jgi:signal transduction histidine kinase/DNA-binding NarL/FixJ family response regulator
MPGFTSFGLPRPDRVAIALLGGLALACMVAAAAITAQVLAQLDGFVSAERDDLQWTLSQLEVDQMRLRLALAGLDRTQPSSVAAVRREFDLLYSRAMTLRSSPTYRNILGSGPAAEEVRQVVALLGEMLPVIDSSDDAIVARRARLDLLAERMTTPVRALGFQAVATDARRSDADRAMLTRQIVKLTTLSLVMLVALGALLVLLLRLYRARLRAEVEIAAARERQLAAEQARARFLGVISHEMRTPLNGLLGALELLEDSGLGPEQDRFTRIMRASGEALRTHIDEALDGLQAETGALTLLCAPFDLDALLAELAEGQRTAARARGNRLHLDLPAAGLGHVLGDRKRLSQVLLNLLSNAIKFTSEGAITLKAVRCDGDWVRFTVADTGIGIPAESLPQVFEDFVRLPMPEGDQPEGTGLGLGIARQLVRLMGGRITAESRPGAGSVFGVRLPLPPAAPEAPQAEAPPPPPHPGAQRVLVVEDTEASREVLAEMLSRDGHAARLAADGLEGVARAEETPFDLILMDIDMPRLDGIEATRRIRAGGGPNARTRIVALTAHYSEATGHRLDAAGIDAIVTKPLSREALRRLLRAPGTAEAAPPLFDAAHLAELAALLPAQHLGQALDGLAREAEGLLAMLDGQSPADLERPLHRLAGMAATCGAIALHARLAGIEAALEAGRQEEAQRLLAGLPALWHDTHAALGAYRSAA